MHLGRHEVELRASRFFGMASCPDIQFAEFGLGRRIVHRELDDFLRLRFHAEIAQLFRQIIAFFLRLIFEVIGIFLFVIFQDSLLEKYVIPGGNMAYIGNAHSTAACPEQAEQQQEREKQKGRTQPTHV
jgi:hypothetical protein